jgi:hypothetical protein
MSQVRRHDHIISGPGPRGGSEHFLPQSAQNKQFMAFRAYHDFRHESSLRPISAVPPLPLMSLAGQRGDGEARRVFVPVARRAAELNLCETVNEKAAA